MIDWHRIETLREEVGPEDFLEVAEMFLAEIEEAVARLEDTVAPEDFAEQMHFIKGSASNLGFQALSTFCADQEKAPSIKTGTSDLVRALFRDSRSVFLAGSRNDATG